jgi:hypothetical protein
LLVSEGNLCKRIGGIFFMLLKHRFLLTGCLLAFLSACGSNNAPNPQTNSASVSTNTQASQTSVTQPTVATASDATAVQDSSTSTTSQPPVVPAGGVDPCSLITNQQVAKVQGGAIKETRSNVRSEGEFLMSQCFYTAEDFVRSVSLSVFQPNPAHPDRQPKQYFTEKFRGAGKKSEEEREKERERERAKERKGKTDGQTTQARGEEEEEEEADAEIVKGIGDEAYWVKTGPSASLYVLKKNQFIVLSIGGGDADSVKLKKTKALAQQALSRLK